MASETEIAPKNATHLNVVSSSVDASIQMEVAKCTSRAGSSGCKQTPFRWDNVFTAYIISLFVTGLALSGSHDCTWTRLIFCFAFLHFAAETSQSWHFIHSGKTALYLSIITIVICVIEAILIWPFPDTLAVLFNLEFLMSDSLSILTSVCLQFNNAMPPTIRVYGLIVSLHFIGVSHRLFQSYNLYFESGTHDGATSPLIVLAALFQLFLGRNVVRGQFNEIGAVVYDEDKNSKLFILFCKFGIPLMAFVVIPGSMVIMSMSQTAGYEGARIGDVFATGLWIDVTTYVLWPISMIGMLVTIYLRAMPSIDESVKKQ